MNIYYNTCIYCFIEYTMNRMFLHADDVAAVDWDCTVVILGLYVEWPSTDVIVAVEKKSVYDIVSVEESSVEDIVKRYCVNSTFYGF